MSCIGGCVVNGVVLLFQYRYKGKIGMAPASMLALTEAQLNVPKEYKFAMTVVSFLRPAAHVGVAQQLLLVCLSLLRTWDMVCLESSSPLPEGVVELIKHEIT